jgi:ABC-type amino acid transport substrate-binding protein
MHTCLRRLAALLLPAALVLLCSLAALPAAAQPAAPATLRVGVVAMPPFAYPDRQGKLTGLGIELWTRVAARLRLDYTLIPISHADVFNALADGRIDVGLGGLVADPKNMKLAHFTQPYMRAGLAIATRPDDRPGIMIALARMDTSGVFAFLGLMILCMAGIALLIWWLERHHNPDHFGGRSVEGIGRSFWWSAVTMTQVGYGDLVPRSLGGRAIALIWMLVSLVLVSVFTGIVTAALTVGQTEGRVRNTADLRGVAIGTSRDSEGAAWLAAQGIGFTAYEDDRAALAAMVTGEVQAVVGLGPELRFFARREFDQAVTVLPHSLSQRWVSFAYRPGLDVGHQIDRTMVETIESEEWERIRTGFLGDNGD